MALASLRRRGSVNLCAVVLDDLLTSLNRCLIGKEDLSGWNRSDMLVNYGITRYSVNLMLETIVAEVNEFFI